VLEEAFGARRSDKRQLVFAWMSAGLHR